MDIHLVLSCTIFQSMKLLPATCTTTSSWTSVVIPVTMLTFSSNMVSLFHGFKNATKLIEPRNIMYSGKKIIPVFNIRTLVFIYLEYWSYTCLKVAVIIFISTSVDFPKFLECHWLSLLDVWKFTFHHCILWDLSIKKYWKVPLDKTHLHQHSLKFILISIS
jgi:hypothetical protein